LAQVKF